MNLRRRTIILGAILLVGIVSLAVTFVASATDARNGEPGTFSDGVYTVTLGDTLSGIAQRFSTTVNNLTSANDIDNANIIYAGQELLIPEPVSNAEVTTENEIEQQDGRITYTVQPGDSLHRIADKFGVPFERLVSENRIAQPNLITSGLVLTIPDEPANVVPRVLQPAEPRNDDNVYIVQAGDSLATIAQRHEISIQALIAENQIGNQALIYPGQQLKLPDPTYEPASAPASVTPSEQDAASIFIWPAEGWIVKYFYYGHWGIDIVVPTGTPVLAMADGRVEFSGWSNVGYGNLVIINHTDGWRTLYAHNSELLVDADQEVAQGEEVAISGSTGYSTMPHVHLEVKKDKRAINPCDELPGGC